MGLTWSHDEENHCFYIRWLCPVHAHPATLTRIERDRVCVNNGGNTNLSEDPKSPNKDKCDFQH